MEMNGDPELMKFFDSYEKHVPTYITENPDNSSSKKDE